MIRLNCRGEENERNGTQEKTGTYQPLPTQASRSHERLTSGQASAEDHEETRQEN